MKRLICWMLCIALMCGFLPAEAAAADPAAARTAEWIVEFDRQELAQSFARETGGRLLSPSDVLVSGGGRLGYLLRPGVTSVTANAVMAGCAQDFVYDDPMLVTSVEEGGYLSYLPDAECQYYLRTIRMYDGWRGVETFLQDSGRTPAPVIVAVLDSGVDGTHPDLTGRVGEGYDIIRGCDIPAGADSDASQVSHGTMAAGLIAAQADNGLGIAGAAGAYPVTIMPVRILNEYDSGTVADTVAGIYWAADHGAQVLNISFGSRMSSFPTAMQTAVDYARSRGCYVIAAAGNDGRALDEFRYHYYPAALEGVLAVGAEKKNIGYGSRYLESSNRPAKGTAGGSFFSICGEDLLTTVRGGGYGLFTGTSASCALFSGLVSLFLSADAARAGACIAGGAYILESDDPAECGTRIDAGEMALGLTGTVSRGSFLADADNPTLVQDETIVFSGTVFAPGVSGAKVCFEVETTRGALLGAETCSCDERGRVTLRMAMPEHMTLLPEQDRIN